MGPKGPPPPPKREGVLLGLPGLYPKVPCKALPVPAFLPWLAFCAVSCPTLTHQGLTSCSASGPGSAGASRALEELCFHLQAYPLVLAPNLSHLDGHSRLLMGLTPPLLSFSHPFSIRLQEGAFSNEKRTRPLCLKHFLGSPCDVHESTGLLCTCS